MAESEASTSWSDRLWAVGLVTFWAVAAAAAWYGVTAVLAIVSDVPEPSDSVFERLRFLEVLWELSFVAAAVAGMSLAHEEVSERDPEPAAYLVCAAVFAVPLVGPFGAGLSLALVVPAGVICGVILLRSERGPHPRSAEVRTATLALTVALGLLGATFVGVHAAVDGANDTPAEFGLVPEYCAYGADSIDQWRGCSLNVSEGRVEKLDTNAARFARGDLDQCLRDAGPFCRPR